MKYLITLIVLILLFGGYYLLAPYFNNTSLDEPLPEIVSEPETTEEDTVSFSTTPAPLIPTPSQPVEGTARIIEEGGSLYLRYEDFKTINGPDLFVYLSTDEKASEFINLGELKATEGNLNYEIPEGVNPEDYPYALVWCKAFGVLFNSAKLY